MIAPEIGNIALVLALVCAILLAVYPMAGAAKGHSALIASARPLAAGMFIFTLIGRLLYGSDFDELNKRASRRPKRRRR